MFLVKLYYISGLPCLFRHDISHFPCLPDTLAIILSNSSFIEACIYLCFLISSFMDLIISRLLALSTLRTLLLTDDTMLLLDITDGSAPTKDSFPFLLSEASLLYPVNFRRLFSVIPLDEAYINFTFSSLSIVF